MTKYQEVWSIPIAVVSSYPVTVQDIEAALGNLLVTVGLRHSYLQRSTRQVAIASSSIIDHVIMRAHLYTFTGGGVNTQHLPEPITTCLSLSSPAIKPVSFYIAYQRLVLNAREDSTSFPDRVLTVLGWSSQNPGLVSTPALSFTALHFNLHTYCLPFATTPPRYI
ncbi:hypothetical protein J6590_050659 [Homalodisca vitripennis]|nr:hypothetical protein J6590_050659 [Homalodisca vitripennis]